MYFIPDILATIWETIYTWVIGWITCFLGGLIPAFPCPFEDPVTID